MLFQGLINGGLGWIGTLQKEYRLVSDGIRVVSYMRNIRLQPTTSQNRLESFKSTAFHSMLVVGYDSFLPFLQ